MSTNQPLLLFYDEMLVAEVCNAFLDQTTSYGDYRIAIDDREPNPASQRVAAYLDACREHNRIYSEGLEDEIDPVACFQAFNVIIYSGKWTMRSPEQTDRLYQAPLFGNDGQVSYMLLDSRE